MAYGAFLKGTDGGAGGVRVASAQGSVEDLRQTHFTSRQVGGRW
jgi:hypothetical protein